NLQAQRMAGHVNGALYLVEYPVDPVRQFLFAQHLVEEQHELVATEAADLHIVRSEMRELVGHGAQQTVADRMAERIVDALEVIEVEHDYGTLPAGIAGSEQLADQLVEPGAVRQIGQRVIARHVADALLGFDARGDLLEGDDAEFVIAGSRRHLEMPAIGGANLQLAVATLAERPRQMRFHVTAVV